MKVVKFIGTGLLIVVLLWLIISLFLPSEIRVERSTEINAPQKLVFDQINTLKTWQQWSYWDNIDPEMRSEYEGPEAGVGAVHKWWSDNDSVGTGSLTIVESEEPSKVITSLWFEGMGGTSTGGWLIDETEDGKSKVTAYMEMNLGFTGRILPGLMMDGWLGPDFEKTLSSLKSHSESIPVEEPRSYTVENVLTPETYVITTNTTCGPDEISAKLGESYATIMMEIQEQKLTISGMPFAIYHHWSPDSVVMEPGIAVSSMGTGNDNVNARQLEPINAIKVDYYGNYQNLGEVHTFIEQYIMENNLTISGSCWESYVTDPGAEPDTSKWLTQVYYPVE